MMPEKKRILLIYYKLFKAGGVAKVFTNLANSLSDEGFSVEILLLMNKRPHFYPLHPEIKVHNLDTFSHFAWSICEFNMKFLRFIPKISNLNAYIYHIGVFLMLRNWMRKNHQNYDTIISSWYKLSSFLAINKLVNYKTIAWEHVTHETGGRLYRDILRSYYKNLKAIVCINTPAILHYKQYKQTIFIPNIIGKPFEDQTHINLGNKKNIISFVGRLDLEKNVMELLEIIKDAEIPNDWKVQIIGEGREKEKLEKFVLENNLKNKISFLGNKDSNEILELLKQSKIFGFTSLKEGLPTVLIESMFCGNALLAYDCNYGPADIMNKKNGFLIPLHDKILFLEKLQMLINNEKILNQYMENSFEESKNWKKEEVLKNWKRLL